MTTLCIKEEFMPELPWFETIKTLVDLGYQGIQKDYDGDRIEIPHKKPRKSKNNPEPELTVEQKNMSKVRVLVENAISGIKRYNILVHSFRNRKTGMDDEAYCLSRRSMELLAGLILLGNNLRSKAMIQNQKHRLRTLTGIGFITVFFLVFLATAWAYGGSNDRRIKRGEEDRADLSQSVGKYWALIIGIDQYRYVDPPLATAVNDARAVAQLLMDRYGFSRNRVLTLHDGEATRKNIIRAFTRLIKEAGPDDLVLIYFAGHGELWHQGRSSFEIRDPEEIKRMKQYGLGFWIPVDAHPGLLDEYLANSTVRNYLSQLNVAHLLVLSDSCYSGGLVQRNFDPRQQDRALNESLSLRSRMLIASGGLHPVPDRSVLDRCAGHSTFACYLLKFLEEEKGNYLTARMLFTHLYEPVISNSSQEPQMASFMNLGHEGGTVRISGGGQHCSGHAGCRTDRFPEGKIKPFRGRYLRGRQIQGKGAPDP